ncbi:MAG: hypothetical protein ACRDLB_01375, partial [Actinomycetota bacterium]
MEFRDALKAIEKHNADLEPGLMTVAEIRDRFQEYEHAERMVAFGKAKLAAALDNATEVARLTGTSVGKAKEAVATAKIIGDAPELGMALQQGDISVDQATEIAKAEESAPGVAGELIPVARDESFQVLREKARAAKLEAEQHRDLGARQRAARSGRSYRDELGMVNVHLKFAPHVGVPIVNRAEVEAARLYKAARRDGKQEPFERHLADAYAKMLSGSSVKGSSRRPKLVVLVSHEVVKRGWSGVRDGEV